MVNVLQPFQLGNLKMAKGSGNTPLARDVSVISNDFSNGAHYRMPWAVSRDLQAVAMSGKELYFRVTDPLLKDVARGGGVKTGFDFECSMLDGTAVPYVTKSYDGAAGTLMGVFKPTALVGSTGPTRGYLYFSNPNWTVSREDHDQTFPSATSVLFLPSGVDKSGAQRDFDADLPTSDKVIVNPGALVDGSMVAGNDIERALTGDCGSFLISFLCQSIPKDVDNAPLTFGSGTGATVIYLRHCVATPNGPHPTTDITNCWRVGFSTGGKEADYETAKDTADQTLQHIVLRRVLGSRPELYINGVLSSFSFTYEDTGTPAILSSRLDFTNQKIIVGRGSNLNNRWWNGYIDCFKFFKDDAKTASWALAEYNNLMDIDGGVIFGSPETVTTSSVFGETIKIQTNQLTSVDFKADKYSLTVGGTIALRSPNPFDAPDFGTFSNQGANTVRYTNTQAQDPDNAGAVHLTNGVGNVIIPVRAHIIISAPPPTSGYYKTPNNFASKSAAANVKTAANRSELMTLLGQFKSNPTWYKTKAIQITGDITGADITWDTGGDANDPLIIFMAGAGTDSSWSSRPTIFTKFTNTRPYLWLYGCQWDWSSGGQHNFENNQVCPHADWTFITACRAAGGGFVRQDANLAVVSNLHINFNRCEARWGNLAAGLYNYQVFICFKSAGQGTNFKVVTPLTVARNYMIDHAANGDTFTGDFCYSGDGADDAGGHSYPNNHIEYNYLKANIKRGIYMKVAPTIRWNDIGPLTQAHGSVYGGADCVIGYRGVGPSDGLCAYNRVRGGIQMMCHGPRHTFLCNVMMSNSTRLRPACHLANAGKPTLAADGARIFGNTGKILLPWFDAADVNPDDPDGKLGDYGGDIQLAGANQTYVEDDTDHVIAFNSAGHPLATAGSNGSRWRNASEITLLSSIPSSYTIEVPPFLDTTVCGPGAAGKVWGT
jgi:hypothetical protein